MSSRQQTKLLIENWRSFLNEQEQLEEIDFQKVKQSVVKFVMEKVKPPVNKFLTEYKTISSEGMPNDIKQKLATDQKFNNFAEAGKNLTTELNKTSELKEALNVVFTNKQHLLEFNKFLEQHEKKLLKEKKQKEIEESLTIAATLGVLLGFAGGTVLLFKGAIKVLDMFKADPNGGVYKFVKKCVVLAETFEGAIKQVISYFTSAAATIFTYFGLYLAKNNSQWLRKKFEGAGVKFLVMQDSPYPPFKVFTRFSEAGSAFSDNLFSAKGAHDFAHGVEHHVEHDRLKKDLMDALPKAKNQNNPYTDPEIQKIADELGFDKAKIRKLNRARNAGKIKKWQDLKEQLTLSEIILEELTLLLEASGNKVVTGEDPEQKVRDSASASTTAGISYLLTRGAYTQEEEDKAFKKAGVSGREELAKLIQNEIRILVKLNADIGYYLLLSFLAFHAGHELLAKGLQGFLSYLEAIATGVKSVELANVGVAITK